MGHHQEAGIRPRHTVPTQKQLEMPGHTHPDDFVSTLGRWAPLPLLLPWTLHPRQQRSGYKEDRKTSGRPAFPPGWADTNSRPVAAIGRPSPGQQVVFPAVTRERP